MSLPPRSQQLLSPSVPLKLTLAPLLASAGVLCVPLALRFLQWLIDGIVE